MLLQRASSKSSVPLSCRYLHRGKHHPFLSNICPGSRLYKANIHTLSEFDRWAWKRFFLLSDPPQWKACFQAVTCRWVPLSVCSNLITLTSVGQKKHYSCKRVLAEPWQNPRERDKKIPLGGHQCEWIVPWLRPTHYWRHLGWAESFVADSEKLDVGNWDVWQFIVHSQMPMECGERSQIQALDTVVRELSVILYK